MKIIMGNDTANDKSLSNVGGGVICDFYYERRAEYKNNTIIETF